MHPDVDKRVVGRCTKRGAEVWFRCAHGDMKGYPMGKVNLEIGGIRKKVKVRIAERLPYDVLLGRDWPAFKQLVREEGEQECMEGRKDPNLSQEQRTHPTLKRARQGQGVTGMGACLILRDGVLYRIGIDPRT